MPLVLAVGCSGGTSDDDDSSAAPSATPEPAHSPQLQLSATSILFGDVNVGEFAEDLVRVTNEGTADLRVAPSIQDELGVFTLTDTTTVTVGPDETTTIIVHFAPNEEKAYIGSLELTTNDENQPLVSVVLAGTGIVVLADEDEDGWTADVDCDDGDPEVYPTAPEVCDGKDNDCDDGQPGGGIDEEGLTTYYADLDNDGHGDSSSPVEACGQETGLAILGDDCDDGDPTRYPSALEVCDGVDNDCDLAIDEEVTLTFFLDADEDGFGASDGTANACAAPSGYVAEDNDCDDSDAAVYPGALEVCNGADDNCDGQIDEGVGASGYPDGDGDGYGDAEGEKTVCGEEAGYVLVAGDCDDSRADVSPAASEVCDGADNDCDGQTDEDVLLDFYPDEDGDGHGAESGAPAQGCEAPEFYAASNDDCDDTNPAVYGGAFDACDGIDNDCDADLPGGGIDEGGDATFYADTDGDGFGDSESTILACEASPGYVSNGDDCNDANPSIYPGAAEQCDGVDEDCDGVPDNGATTTFFRDSDGDGHGVSIGPPAITSVKNEARARASGTADDEGGEGDTVDACVAPEGYVASSDDCDDSDASVYPGAEERCNGLDDDCDAGKAGGGIDEGVKSTFYADADGDGYGVSTSTAQACAAPEGFSDVAGDCNDGDPASYPEAPEVCDGQDNDCDRATDEDVKTAYYLDADGDGYGRDSSAVLACAPPTAAYIDAGGDCNDLIPTINPAGIETCNDLDDDCDGETDEDEATDVLTWYHDGDGDGFGDPLVSELDCNTPSGYVPNAEDCDDTSGAVNPDALETCNGTDDDCNDTIDDNPQDPSTFYADADGDGYGRTADTEAACLAPEGYSAVSGDCNDTDPAVNPGALELCNEIDDDCDVRVDELEECLTVLQGSQSPNRYAYVTEDVLSGDAEVAVSDATDFQAGDLVLLIQVQGDPAGYFELLEVASAGSNTLAFQEAVGRDYLAGPYDQGGAYAVQAVKVAFYNNLVLDGAQLTAPAWDGYTGGIIAIWADFDVEMQNGASISVSRTGFRGPARETARASNGRVGEGILGNTGTRCANQNTEPDTYTGGCGGIEGIYNSSDALGGAGGGANASEPPNDAVSYGSRYPAKSGNPYGVGDPNVMIPGGGGGQGDSGANDWNSLAKGGNGGGLIFIWARDVYGNGSILADGENGEQGCDYTGSGGDWGVSGGGGGAGGSIRIEASSIESLSFLARGGAGGDVCYHTSYHSASGGSGRIVLLADTINNVTTNPGYLE